MLARSDLARAFISLVSVMMSSFLCVPKFCDAEPAHWVTAYYGAWELGNGSNGYLPVSDVDFSAFTDVIDFALVPNADGTIDTSTNGITSEGTEKLIRAAHSASAKVLICVGGAGSGTDFERATDTGHLSEFVRNLIDFVRVNKFDGIDIDWEPINAQDYYPFTALARALHDSLKAISKADFLTTTCSPGNKKIMSLDQNYFEQVNIMTYEMSFPTGGWVVWFNSPVYDGGLKFPGLKTHLPSIKAVVDNFEKAGVAPDKIGIGAELGGTVWTGVTEPDESLFSLNSVMYDVPLYSHDSTGIMQHYYKPYYYHWDSLAQVGYLSIPQQRGKPACFVSYDDSASIEAKARFIRKEGLGGIIIYELGMGYPGHGSYPLLQSIKSDFLYYVPITSGNVGLFGSLYQNYPNPFNPVTAISFRIDTPAHVTLDIYNILGERIATLIDSYLLPGSYSREWNGSGDASGVYLFALRINNVSIMRKMVLLK